MIFDRICNDLDPYPLVETSIIYTMVIWDPPDVMTKFVMVKQWMIGKNPDWMETGKNKTLWKDDIWIKIDGSKPG